MMVNKVVSKQIFALLYMRFMGKGKLYFTGKYDFIDLRNF